MSKFHCHEKSQFILKTNLKCIPIQKGSINVFENSFWAYGTKMVLEMRMKFLKTLKSYLKVLKIIFHKHTTKQGNQNK